MSKVNDIKKMKREKGIITPAQALNQTIGFEPTAVVEPKEENIISSKEEILVTSNQENNETRKEEKKVERRRVSFDIRTDLYKELKMQAIDQDKNIYIMIEEALEKYLKENK